MENKLKKKENNQLITESEVESKLNILVKGQTNNLKQLQAIRNDLQRGFIGLALRNEALLKSNDLLKQQLDGVLKELNLIKQEREEKESDKGRRFSRVLQTSPGLYNRPFEQRYDSDKKEVETIIKDWRGKEVREKKQVDETPDWAKFD